ncbi:hypothetical protein M2373_001408 [Chryseobacterium sp. JUb7]|nr:hypothetical protein [Chryseobacterium sp. JUb7]
MPKVNLDNGDYYLLKLYIISHTLYKIIKLKTILQ